MTGWAEWDKATNMLRATPDERAAAFGESFRDITIASFDVTPEGVMVTVVLLDDELVTLIGDPERALATCQFAVDLRSSGEILESLLARLKPGAGHGA